MYLFIGRLIFVVTFMAMLFFSCLGNNNKVSDNDAQHHNISLSCGTNYKFTEQDIDFVKTTTLNVLHSINRDTFIDTTIKTTCDLHFWITRGSLISKTSKHAALFIQNSPDYTVFIFEQKAGKWVEIDSLSIGSDVSDFIDLNNDGLNDLVVEYFLMTSNGRFYKFPDSYFELYLFDKKQHRFSKSKDDKTMRAFELILRKDERYADYFVK